MYLNTNVFKASWNLHQDIFELVIGSVVNGETVLVLGLVEETQGQENLKSVECVNSGLGKETVH